MKLQSIPYLRRKADREMQLWGRRTFKYCEICGRPMSCLHHLFPKSLSSALRYNEKNLIPICVSCHFQHHCSNNPEIHQTIIQKRGNKWFEELKKIKNTIIKISKGYYREVIERFKNK